MIGFLSKLPSEGDTLGARLPSDSMGLEDKLLDGEETKAGPAADEECLD